MADARCDKNSDRSVPEMLDKNAFTRKGHAKTFSKNIQIRKCKIDAISLVSFFLYRRGVNWQSAQRCQIHFSKLSSRGQCGLMFGLDNAPETDRLDHLPTSIDHRTFRSSWTFNFYRRRSLFLFSICVNHYVNQCQFATISYSCRINFRHGRPERSKRRTER